MPITDAMRRALELHKPAPKLPDWKANRPEEKAIAQALNARRASLNSDSYAVMVNIFQRAMQMQQVSFDDTAAHLGTFHEPFKHPAVDDVLGLRVNLLDEEVYETQNAIFQNDLVEYVDGNLDVIYIALGSLLSIGLKPGEIDELFTEVHASNMTKFDENGEPVLNGVTPGYREGEPHFKPDLPVGKVIKSSQYIPADIVGILKRIYSSRTTS